MKQRGVTFLELVICIGILGIIGSSTMLLLGQALRKQELTNASMLLVSDLRWLQQLSMNSGGELAYLLRFNEATPSGYCITANTKVIKTMIFPPSIRLYVPYSMISFAPSGAPLTGAQTISLQSGTESIWKYVILAPVTGRLRISNTMPHQEGE